MSLLSYDDVRPWARAIKSKVVSREMPPWGADPDQGLKMRNDPSLSKTQIDTIAAWVDGGAPRGNDADLPPAPKFARDGRSAASPTTCSRCRSSSTSPPKASWACRCSIRRFRSRRSFCRGPRDPARQSRGRASRRRLRRRHSRRCDARQRPPDGQDGKVIGDRGSSGLPRTEGMGLPGSAKLLSWVPGRGVDAHRPNVGKRIPAGKYH